MNVEQVSLFAVQKRIDKRALKEAQKAARRSLRKVYRGDVKALKAQHKQELKSERQDLKLRQEQSDGAVVHEFEQRARELALADLLALKIADHDLQHPQQQN